MMTNKNLNLNREELAEVDQPLCAQSLFAVRERDWPEVEAVTIDEVAPLRVLVDVVAAAKHGRKHCVLVAPQCGQASGEQGPTHIQWQDLRKLHNKKHIIQNSWAKCCFWQKQ